MDRTDLAQLSRVQQDLEDSAFIMERITKRLRETTEGLSEKVNESISDGWKVAGTMAVVVKDIPTTADDDNKNR